ncbi:MAG: TerD family protein [Synergistaceae bacterium]|jgi:tellurite resistance protein TerA|nr:TerD family protein [Synergistaceae bacterium]
MKAVQRGFRDKLENYADLSREFPVRVKVDGRAEYDFCCFGVDDSDKLSDDRYMVFFNQTRTPNGEITLSQSSGGADFGVDVSKLPGAVNKLVFTVNIDGDSTMGDIGSLELTVGDEGRGLSLSMSGRDFHREKAVIAVEIYRKDSWRVACVASGFDGGLKELLKRYGGEEAAGGMAPSKGAEPADERPASAGTKVELRKGQKISLEKRGGGLGEILINLNWTKKQRILRKIDLDLGCLYEMKGGEKGSVQALGNNFGDLNNLPYIALDGDDRTGASESGENLRVNGKMISKIKRILVYTFIYSGAANWKDADGVVTLKYPGGSDIIVRMDEYGSSDNMCAIALLENVSETFSVEKIVRFFRGHRAMDEAFGWGLRWVTGRK